MEQNSYKNWQDLYLQETKKAAIKPFISPEGIAIKPLYCQDDLKERGYEPSYPGIFPFTRGPKASMYVGQPWTVRQYAGFSTAKESNAFYRQNLAQGQTGLSVAFDLPTHRGYDSDHERVQGDVGKAGVAIDSVKDMEVLFSSIPLDKISVSMTMNGAILPVFAAFVAAAQNQGVSKEKLRGTIQNDILKEYMVRNTYIYPPESSMRIVSDIISFVATQMPKFNSISISGYHMQEAGADSALELAYTIADGMEYTKAALSRGLSIDQFAPTLSFFFAIGMNFFMEICKLRAARTLWANYIKTLNPKDPRSLLLRTHCQTSGYSLTEKDPYNNIVRTTIEAMAATLGGTQSLHTNAFDEAIALPTDFSAKIARNTQLILQEETDLCQVVDPFGGSYFIESLTSDLVKRAQALISEVEESGGMTQAVLSGLAKSRIEEAAARKQARLDQGQDVIVGVNKYQSNKSDISHDIRKVDNIEVLKNQIDQLTMIKKNRNEKEVQKALFALKEAAKGKTNLVPLAIHAMLVHATVGEVSFALEEVFGRYEGASMAVSNVIASAYQKNEDFAKTLDRTQKLAAKLGRQPRILIGKLGQDGHDRGSKVVAAGFSDLGFDVDLAPLFMTPKEVAKQAVENDVHVVGISTQAGGHNTLLPKLREELDKAGAKDILIICGGIIPKSDHDHLHKAGVVAIFAPATPLLESVNEVLSLLEKQHGHKR